MNPKNPAKPNIHFHPGMNPNAARQPRTHPVRATLRANREVNVNPNEGGNSGVPSPALLEVVAAACGAEVPAIVSTAVLPGWPAGSAIPVPSPMHAAPLHPAARQFAPRACKTTVAGIFRAAIRDRKSVV